MQGIDKSRISLKLSLFLKLMSSNVHYFSEAAHVNL